MPSLLTQMERVPVDSLVFYPGNPRHGNVAAIAESLTENAQYAPIVVQRSTRHVLSGNHTLKAAQSLGWTEIDAVLVDVDDDRARKIVLSSNRTAELAGYDDEALAGLLEELNADFDGTGWTAEDLDGFRQLLAPPDLDKLGKELGEPGADDAWPTVRIRAPHNVVAAWNDYLKTRGGDDAEAFAALLDVEVLG